MTDKRRRGFWGTLGCLVGLHDFRVERCRGIPEQRGMAYWFADNNFDWRCIRCGHMKPSKANAPRQPEPASGDRLHADVGTESGGGKCR